MKGLFGLKNDIVIKYKDKTIVGLTEKVVVYGPHGKKTIMARIDTGATKSSIDVALAAELNLGPIVKTKVIQSASGATVRPIIKVKLELANKEFEKMFTLADRKMLKYRMLIGQNILLNSGFLIDPSKKC